MITTFKMKKGDTFSYYANVKDANGNPVIDGVDKIKSQIYNDKDIKLADLTITTTDVVGKYLFRVLNTTTFPTDATLFTDIQYTDGDVIVSSETMTIQILKDVTR